MALILNLETSTRNCSVALARDGYMLAINEIAGEGYLHAEKLHLFIRKTVQDAVCDISDIDSVAVSMGPGSYTGLRIGVSAAKGICYALGLPLIAVDTLQVLARQIVAGKDEFIVPLIDARRMEAYTAIYDHSYSAVRKTLAEIITADTFNSIPGRLHLVGDGAAKCSGLLDGDRFIYHENILFPSAAQMCEISEAKNKIGDTVDVAYFEPFYLKDFIAGKKL